MQVFKHLRMTVIELPGTKVILRISNEYNWSNMCCNIKIDDLALE